MASIRDQILNKTYEYKDVLSNTNQPTGTFSNAANNNTNQRSGNILNRIGKDVLNIGLRVGEGALDVGDWLVDTALQIGSSKLNPYYWFNPDELDSHQNIARELISQTNTTNSKKALGYTDELQQKLNNNTLFGEDSFAGQTARSIGTEITKAVITGGLSGGKVLNAVKLSPVISAIQGYGSGVSEAYNYGVTDRTTANIAGVANAAVEFLTDKIVPGSPGFRNAKEGSKTLINALKDYGLNTVGEGAEELLSAIISPIINEFIYTGEKGKSIDETLLSGIGKVNMKEALLEGLAGMIVGGFLDSPNLISNIQEANLTQKQRQERDKLQKEIIAELKKENEQTPSAKLPKDAAVKGDLHAIDARINFLEDKISTVTNVKDIDIEGIAAELKLLREEKLEITKQASPEIQKEVLEQLTLDLDVLENTPSEQQTEVTQEKIKIKKEQQAKIINEIDKDKVIKTTYNKQFILDNKESLLVDAQNIVSEMNTNKTTEKPVEIQLETEYDETQQRISDVAAAFKKQVVFLKNSNFGGMVPLQNENLIFIGDNINNDLILSNNKVDQMTYTLGHELFHSLKMSQPEIFNEFTNFVKTEVTEEQLVKFMEKYDPTDEFGLLKGIQIDGKFDLETIKADPKKYASQNKALNYIVEEMVANEFGGMITDKKYMTDLKNKNKGLFTKIVKALKTLFNEIDAPIYNSPLTQLQVTKIRKDFENIIKEIQTKETKTEIKPIIETLYHGSNELFDRFNLKKSKEKSTSVNLKQGHHFADNIDEASKYGKYIYEINVEKGQYERTQPSDLNYTGENIWYVINDDNIEIKNIYDNDMTINAIEIKSQIEEKKKKIERLKNNLSQEHPTWKSNWKEDMTKELKQNEQQLQSLEEQLKNKYAIKQKETKPVVQEVIKPSKKLDENRIIDITPVKTTQMTLEERKRAIDRNLTNYRREENSRRKTELKNGLIKIYDAYQKAGGTEVIQQIEDFKKEEFKNKITEKKLLPSKEELSKTELNDLFYKASYDYDTAIQSGAKAIKERAIVTYEEYKRLGGKKIIKGLETNKMLPSKEQPTQHATAAPYYNTKITSDNFNVIKDKVHAEFNKKAHEFAGELGIEIANVSINKGGFTFQEGKNAGKQVEELSYTYELKNATPQQADYFASLLGDLGYEGQEAVIAYNYVEPNDTSANIVEFGIKVNNTDGVSEILKKNGVSDYTIDTTEGVIKILDFDMTNQDATIDKIDNIIRDLGGKYEKITRQTANSRYLDSETRRKAYKEWLQTNRTDAQNRNLRSHIEQAQKKIGDVKYLPTKDDKTTGISEFVTNTLEKSPAFDFLREEIKKDPSFGQYEKLSKDVVKSKTEELIKNRLDETIDKIHKGTEVLNPMEQQIAATMINEYDRRGDIDSAMSLTKLLQSGTVTPAAQALEAVKRLQKNPYYIVNDFKNMVDKMNEEFMNSNDRTIKNWLKEHSKGVELTAADTEYILQMAKKLENLDENSQEYAQRWALINTYIANKMPKNFWTKVKNFRRMGFLFNPKTMIRNWAGNVMMDPVYKVTDMFGSKLDEYLSKIYGTQRTTGTTDNKLYRKAKKEGTQISKQDYELGITTSLGNPYEIMAGQTFNPDNLVGRTLNEVEKLTNYLMSRGDRGFENAHYVGTLTNLMRLNDVDVATQEMIQLAKDTAAKRTWKNNGKMVKTAGQIRSLFNQIGIKDGKFGKHEVGSKVDIGLGDIILPFIMTPSNLLVATYDFSPAAAISAVRNWNALKETIKKGGNVLDAQKTFVDSVSKATTGTLLFIIAGALAKMGVITGGEDEDKDKRELDKILGNQPYSIKIGDMSFTYDWAQPLSNIFATMGEVQRQKDVGKTNFLKTVGDAFTTGGDRLLEQSFLQNIRTLLGGGYNDDSLGERFIDLTLDIPPSMVPTLFKQFADFLDGNIKTTYDKNNPLQTMISKVMARVPIVKSALPTKKDVLGNDLKYHSNVGEGLLTSFLSPMNIKKDVAGELGDEITDVFNHTGDKTIIPQVAIKYIDYDSDGDGKVERFNFNPTQQSQLQEAMGKIVSDAFGNIFANDVYMNATYDDKAKALTSLMEYSKGKALEDLGLVPNYTSGNPNVKQIKNYIDSGLDVSNAIMYDSMINPIQSDLDADGKAISGTLQGKKAFTIMNMQISDGAKNTMLNLITTSKNPETVDTLRKLSTQQQFIEYYSLNRSDTFVMEKFSRDDYDVATTKFNIDGKEFMKAVSGLSEIKSDVDKNGKTIENSKKNKTIQYINSLPLNQIQKIYMYGMAGYSVKQWRNELYNHINSLPMTSQEKKDLWKQLGLE